ncbi:ABC transporter substrate-binding protein [Falsiroseomonas sp. E2-1-a20]|uniref:ABC transporter substrate-binding protein n=1 Tax=Falsiroseomonas sp. E2-1-a20 TaxID=3239300 RepID=UPI003F2E3234
MNRRGLLATGGALALGGATGFNIHSALAQQPRLASSQVLRFAVGVDDIRSVDPHFSIGVGEQPVTRSVYEGLLLFPDGAISGEDLRPGLAERWASSDDRKTWTFHLRRGVQWHHGHGLFSADDVVFSLDRVRGREAGSPFRNTLADIEAVEALDSHTVRIVLKNPDANFTGLLVDYAAGFIVCKRALESGVDLRTRPVGTGPFQATEYRSRESFTLQRHDAYWGGKPAVERIVVQFMSDASTRELALRGGELHAIEIAARQDVVDRMRRARMEVDLTAPANMFTLHFNTSMAPFNDIRVRRAIAHATNRDELLAFLGRDVSKPEFSPLPSGYVGHTGEVPRYAFDQDRARALLGEAGLGSGITLNTPVSNNSIYLPPMQVLQEQWKKVGVNLDLRVVDHPTYHRLIRENVAPVVIYGAYRYPLTGRLYFDQFYHSGATVGRPTAITNFSHFSGADAEIEAARFETDAEKQKQLWITVQRKIMEESVAIPLFTRSYAMARSPKLDLGHEQKSWSFYTVSPRTRLLA